MSHTQLTQIKDDALKAFNAAESTQELYSFKVQYLGKSGTLTEVMKLMAGLPKEEKPLLVGGGLEVEEGNAKIIVDSFILFDEVLKKTKKIF